MTIPSLMEKASFGIPVAMLFLEGRFIVAYL
jgi:hypothetical protein